MKTFSREELLELAPAYAVGATNAEESAAIEAALPTSPDLAAEVASFRDVTVTIAEQQRPVVPSASVRAEFLQRIGESKNALFVPPASSASAGVTRTPPSMFMALAAAVLLAIGFGLHDAKQARVIRETEQQLADNARAIAAADSAAHKYHQDLDDILTAEKSLRVVHMTSADTATGPGMQFFWNLKNQVAILHAFRLKPAPAGRAYQLWFLVNGKPVSAKVFNSDPDGHALVTDITLPASPTGVTDVLLTEEPAGGSPGPTTTPFVGGKMPAI